MKMGIVIFLSLAALFICAALITKGKSVNWFFKPEHKLTKRLVRFFWIIVVASVIMIIRKI